MKRAAIPKRPFRDSAIVYGSLSLIIVIVGSLLGRPLLPKLDGGRFVDVGTLLTAIVFFALATSYAWWRFQRRIDREGSK